LSKNDFCLRAKKKNYNFAQWPEKREEKKFATRGPVRFWLQTNCAGWNFGVNQYGMAGIQFQI
jgi:hypothetical protein